MVIALRCEEAIVAKPTFAPLFPGYGALHYTFKSALYTSLNESHNGAESGRAVLGTIQLAQQLLSIGCKVVTISGVASRVYARSATQGIYLKPCIIGKAIASALLVDVASLGECIALNGGFVLGNIFGYACLS